MKKLIIILIVILTIYCFYSLTLRRTPQEGEQAEFTPLPIEEYTEGIKEPEEPKFTDEDIILIAKVVYAESRGECDEGQRAVARVILNRVESELYPDTVSEVIKQQGQFVIGSRYTEKEMRNVEYVLENGFDMPADVMYFGTWRFRQGEAIKTGNHYFMR
jgi:spore germination cell wall hydrolase CwlJ-like protein